MFVCLFVLVLLGFLVPAFSCSNLALRSWNKIFFPVQSLWGGVYVSVSFSARRGRGFTVFNSLEVGNTLTKGKEACGGFPTLSASLPPAAPAGSGEQQAALGAPFPYEKPPACRRTDGCWVHKKMNVDAYLRKSATSCAFTERLYGGRTVLRKWVVRLQSIR